MRNIETVKAFYATLDKSYLSPDVVIEITEDFPESGVYKGPDGFFGVFFPRLMAHFLDWKTQPQEFLDAGEKVVVLGNYSATATATGVDFSAPFVHTWTLADEKMVRLQQLANTMIIQRALGWIKASGPSGGSPI
jgi:uncharacterized protein